MKLPAFQFYPADWRKDPGVQSLSYQDRGIWFEMLCLMHESDDRGKLLLNGMPMPEEALAHILGLDNQILTTTLTTLLTRGVASKEPSTGVIYCRRMVRDENIRKVRSESGKKGGNPLLLNQNSTTGVNQIPTPSSSSSSSSSSSDHNRKRGLPEVPAMSRKEYDALVDLRGYPKEMAEWFWNDCEKVNWLDQKGRVITNVDAALKNLAVRWRSNGTKSGGNIAVKSVGGVDPNYVDCGTACARADASRAKRDAKLKEAPFVPHNPRQFMQNQ